MFGLGKKKKSVAPARKPSALSRWWDNMPASRRRTIGRLYLLAIAAVLLTGGAVYGMKVMERQALAGQLGPVPTSFKVVLAQAPAYIPASLLQQIALSITPADSNPSDQQLAQKVYQLASACPWISKVGQALCRPATDPRIIVVEVQAEFRTPYAKVQCMKSRNAEQVEYVDKDGIVLPSDQAARYFVQAPATADLPARDVFFVRRADIPAGWKFYAIHYITIEGVMAPPPPAGQKWDGDDLAAGLKLVTLVSTRKYANQIKTVDVRNYAGRGRHGDSNLCMRAQIGNGPETIIRFGRFPAATGDWEVPTQRKMYNLDTYVSDQKGYLAGTAQYVDLRGDQLRFRPNDQ